MKKNVKRTFTALTLASLLGATAVSARTMTPDEMKSLAEQSIDLNDPSYIDEYVWGNTVFFKEIYTKDLVNGVNSGAVSDDDNPILYYREGETSTWKDAVTNENLAETDVPTTFQMSRLIGDKAEDAEHISSYKAAYDVFLKEIDNHKFDNRTVEIFADEVSKVTVPTAVSTDLGTKLRDELKFDTATAYGTEGITFTLKDGIYYAKGVVKKQANDVNTAYGEGATGYYFAYELDIPGATSKTVVYLNSKEIPYEKFDVKPVNNEDPAKLVILKAISESTKKENRKYVIKVDLDGEGTENAPTTVTIDWSGIVFEKESSATIVGNVELPDNENWKYQSGKTHLDFADMVENKVTITGYLEKQDNVIGFGGSAKTGYYFTFALDFSETGLTKDKLQNLSVTIPGVNGGNPITSKDIEETEDGKLRLNIILSVNPDSPTTKEITIDLDGATGEEFTPVKYTLDYSKVTFGLESTMLPQPLDSHTHLEQAYQWEKPTIHDIKFGTPTFDEDGNKVIKLTGTIEKSNVGDAAGFGVNQGYFVGWILDTQTGMKFKDNDKVTVTITGDTTSKLNKSNFDTDTAIYMLSMFNPEGKSKDKRRFTVTIDYDGEEHAYSESKYIIDWSELEFVEETKADIIIDEKEIPTSELDVLKSWGYQTQSGLKITNDGNNYTVTGDITEHHLIEGIFNETEETGYYFAINIKPLLDNVLNLNVDTSKITISVANGENKKNEFKFADLVNNSLTVLVHVPSDHAGTKGKLTIEVDLDGEGTTFKKTVYTVDYSAVNTKYEKVITAEKTIPSDVATEFKESYGYLLANGGKFTFNSSIGKDGSNTIYVNGYVLPVKDVNDTAFTQDDNSSDFYLPMALNITNANNLKSIVVKKDSGDQEKTFDDNHNKVAFEAIKSSGKLNALRLLGNTKESKGRESFSIIFTYTEDSTAVTVNIDLSNLQYDLTGAFVAAYNKTVAMDYTTVDDSIITVSAGEERHVNELNKKVDWLKALNPELTGGDAGTDYVVSAVEDTTDCDETICLNVTFKSIPYNSYINTNTNGFLKDLFLTALNKYRPVFHISINADGYITNVKGEFEDNIDTKKATVNYNKGTDDLIFEYIKKLVVNYSLSNFVPKKEVEFNAASEDVTEKPLKEHSTEFKDKFVDKENKKSGDADYIDMDDERFKFEDVYSKIGVVENSQITSITVGKHTYSSNPTSISVGNNVFIQAPIFVVMNDTLYVSTAHLIAENTEKVSVTYGETTFEVSNNIGVQEVPTALEIDSAMLLFKQSGYTQDLQPAVKNADGSYTIKLTSGHGKQAIGLKFKDLVTTESDIAYVLHEDGSMSVTSAYETLDGDTYHYAVYLAYNKGEAYTAENKNKNIKETIIIPGKGTITINFELIVQVKA